MPRGKPYHTIEEERNPLCKECIHSERCHQRNDAEYFCVHQETLEDVANVKNRKTQILKIVSTFEGAKELWDDINKYIYNPNLNTGNSLTQYNLGLRGKVLERVSELCEALELHDHTDLTIYLHKILQGANHNGN